MLTQILNNVEGEFLAVNLDSRLCVVYIIEVQIHIIHNLIETVWIVKYINATCATVERQSADNWLFFLFLFMTDMYIHVVCIKC